MRQLSNPFQSKLYLDDLPERDLGGEGVAVIDDGLAVIAVPAVEFNTSATAQ